MRQTVQSRRRSHRLTNGSRHSAEASPHTAPLSLEDVDIARHREITSKAVSAIILLLMKWFKASRKPRDSSPDLVPSLADWYCPCETLPDIIKMQYLSTLLIDSNCLLLILKMFGLQELLSTVQIKNEWEDHKSVCRRWVGLCGLN